MAQTTMALEATLRPVARRSAWGGARVQGTRCDAWRGPVDGPRTTERRAPRTKTPTPQTQKQGGQALARVPLGAQNVSFED